MVLLPKMTTDNYRVWGTHLINSKTENFVYDDALMGFMMVHDLMAITHTEEGELADGDVVIFDCANLTASHLSRIGLSSLKCFVKFLIEAHPVRIKQVHIINMHSIGNMLMYIMKPFLSARVMKVVHFHSPKSTTLFDFVPKEMLTTEFGGDLGPNKTISAHWEQKIREQR